MLHLFSSKAIYGFEVNKHQTILLHSKREKKNPQQTSNTPCRYCRFYPTLGRAGIHYLLFTGSITITNEMKFYSRSPFPLWSPVLTAASHIPQPGRGPRCVWVPEAGDGDTSCLSPLQLHLWEEAATEGRKQKYLPMPLLPLLWSSQAQHAPG